MGVKRSLVRFLHDEGYGEDLVRYINSAVRGKDMVAETAFDGDVLSELIAACECLMNEYDIGSRIQSVELRMKCRAAIEKAKGE